MVFHPGPMGIFEQSLALQERGWLGAMVMDFYCDLSSPPYKWLPEGRVKKYFRKRYHPPLNSTQIHTVPLTAVRTRIATRLAWRDRSRVRLVFQHNSKIDRWVAARVTRLGNLFFGYEGASFYTFRKAKALGLPCVLYQPVACAEKAAALLNAEKDLFPKLADTLRYRWFPDGVLEMMDEERRLADKIICASAFTKESLVEIGVEADKVCVEPYGVNQEVFAPSDDKFPRFSIIWASSYTQTKGIGYLLEALAREPVPGLELVLAGNPYGVDAVSLYEGRVRARRLGHISRQELGRVMRRCHAHVYPTLLDGFGRNIIEAMSSGLPVITTPNCAGPDLIEDGVTGFIIPIRDIDSICEKLAWIHDNPQAASEMGRRARERVSGLTEPDYRRRFAERIYKVWQGRTGG